MMMRSLAGVKLQRLELPVLGNGKAFLANGLPVAQKKKKKTQQQWQFLRSRRECVIVRASANLEGFKEKSPLEGNPILDTMAAAAAMNSSEENPTNAEGLQDDEDLQRKSRHFEKIQDVPAEERDRLQKEQLIDRAAAAITATNALKAEISQLRNGNSQSPLHGTEEWTSANTQEPQKSSQVPGIPTYESSSESHLKSTPGPDFWSWSPPPDERKEASETLLTPQMLSESKENLNTELLEKEKSFGTLDLPFQSKFPPFQEPHSFSENQPEPSLPPLQSVMEYANTKVSQESIDSAVLPEESTFLSITELTGSQHASEIASVLGQRETEQTKTSGVNPDGSRWWKETGIENRPNGVTCNWTVVRGVNSNGDVEWEEKYWEAFDDYDYKELGSEKSGRDAAGNVWREFWKESMWQDVMTGLVNIEKTADKWAKNAQNAQWQEKWWEHYDARGHTEKWSDKWCQIDLNTALEDGHAHVWHERWGEKFDGKGSCMKYTDKWAERLVGENTWTKWGDKWDERFDENGHGVKQGETWWEGAAGEKWNRTWGEQHDGSGFVHKYGKSSSGEHWDVSEEQETWYEKYPHFGFRNAYENSKALRRVRKYFRPKL